MRSVLNHIAIVSPSAEQDLLGNSMTAVRWAHLIRALGNQVTLSTEWAGEEADLLVALHARRSNPSIERFRRAHSDHPIVVALTGTDLYSDLPGSAAARRSLALATRIIALHDRARDVLDPEARAKLRVVYQSAIPPAENRAPRDDCFEVCVLSHLREVKDPLRAAFAARDLPSYSKIRILHAGRALEPTWAEQARAEEQVSPRYSWLGELNHEAALALLARSRLMVLSSEVEGGANVIAEAVVCGVPVVCSRIPGNIGMLGPDYKGYFSLRDTDGLRTLLIRIETDLSFLEELQAFVNGLKDRFDPHREMEAWRNLLEEL